MSVPLTPEEVAIIIRARRLLKEKGLPPDTDVKTLCSQAGISRKTGYQWEKRLDQSPQDEPLREELARLKTEHDKLKKAYDDVSWENEGRKIAWEIHEVDTMIAEKKKHYGQAQKEKAVAFLRSTSRPERQAAWVLVVPPSTLLAWNQGFDENLKPLTLPEKRGKAAKVTVDMVRRIIEHAKGYQNRRIRLKTFAAELREAGIDLSAKTIEEILIANDLYKTRVRKKRPAFYQSLCQTVPNGLLSIDGSEVVVWLGDTVYPFNVELAVDVATFAHTAFSVDDSETAAAVIKVLDAHRQGWGIPIGVLGDCGSANDSGTVLRYLDDWGIQRVPVGPGNPKGNGTDEGAFSQMKKALGQIRIDTTSPKCLARSVLEALVSVYVYMRNRLPVHLRRMPPCQHMALPVSDERRTAERRRLDAHVAARSNNEADQVKLDRLDWVIRHYGLDVAPDALKHAQRTIKAYELEAIRQTEEAFLKATRRNAGRTNLAYFFGILKNIQRKLDEDAKRDYCRQRYNHEVMLMLERQKQEESSPVSIDAILDMLSKAVIYKVRFVKELAIRKAREWTFELIKSCRYLGPLKSKVEASLGKFTNLSIDQRNEVWELFCQFLNNNQQESRVTLI